jgi:cysteine desulfuration protein SufE
MTPLADLIDVFNMVEGTSRIELLHDYGANLPELPESYRAIRDAGLFMVHECQAPVFMKTVVEDGMVRIFADVPREAPTARGFLGVLIELFEGARSSLVLDAPEARTFLDALGIWELLGMQRRHGLTAIYRALKDQVYSNT